MINKEDLDKDREHISKLRAEGYIRVEAGVIAECLIGLTEVLTEIRDIMKADSQHLVE